MAIVWVDKMVVDVRGEGDAVVCVHGLGGSMNAWTPLLPALQRHRVLRVELPGAGRSRRAYALGDRDAVGGKLAIEQHVQAVLRVCSVLGVARAHFVGHSLGTIVCQHLAVAAPKLVRSLALLGPLMALPETARAALRVRAAKARSEGAAGMHDISLALVNSALSTDTRQRQPLAVAFVRESLMRQEPDNYARTIDALVAAQPAALDAITAPVLLLTGDDDGVAPPQAVRAMAERFHRSVNVRVQVYTHCGHWTPVERSAECQSDLAAFLSAQR